MTTLAVLVFGGGMCGVAAFLYSSVGGDILAPVTAGRWVGSPMLVLVVLFALDQGMSHGAQAAALSDRVCR